MDHARKMVLVPEESIEKLKTASAIPENGSSSSSNGNDVAISVQTSGSNLSRLDNEMVQLLNSSVLNDRDKWARYQQVQQRYLNFRNNPASNSSGSGSSGKNAEKEASRRGVSRDTIILSVPQSFKRKTEILLQLLDSPHVEQRIAWDRRGEVTIDDKILPRSNIIDLINDTIRLRKNIQSHGREHFSWFLRDIGVPAEIFGNHELYEIGSDFNRSSSSISFSSPFNSGSNKRFSSTPKSRDSLKKKRLSFRDDDVDSNNSISLLDSTIVAAKSTKSAKKKLSASLQKNQSGHGWLSLA